MQGQKTSRAGGQVGGQGHKPRKVAPRHLTARQATQLERFIYELTAEREAFDTKSGATREEQRAAYAASERCNALIYSARVALRERRARRGDSRAAALARRQSAWDTRHPWCDCGADAYLPWFHRYAPPCPAYRPMVTPQILTKEMIREVCDCVMGGSLLSEDTRVALGDLALDDGDPDVNQAVARDRLCAWINQRACESNRSRRRRASRSATAGPKLRAQEGK